ncbi:MAG: glutamate--tRNA ligase [Gammaproteobacteria bacterium]|nr:glutamate--tRNA ligase [Gammaproteobacteria bacterium]
MTFRTRFAPSPTGYLHVGGARTALYCWLQARKERGVFVLRIEDTDRERSTDAAVSAILESMDWLGLEADEGPIFQTHRFDRYDEVIEQLLTRGHAYPCYCSHEELDKMRLAQKKAGQKPRYDGRCRERTDVPSGVSPVVRFKSPTSGETSWKDLVRGQLRFSNSELDDLVIRRSDGTPTYNFTVVIDDMDMHITHVIRGDDHINNTPRQINIYDALDTPVPRFAHVPMILGADGARLSKRHGAVSVLEYRERGILPAALLNYLVRLGWSHGDQELFTLEELQELFDIRDVNRAASEFNDEKLLWINQQHIIRADKSYLAQLLDERFQSMKIDTSQGPDLGDVVEVYRERAVTIVEMAEQCRFLFEDFAEYDPGAAKKHLRPVVLEGLQALRVALAGLESWNRVAIETVFNELLVELNIKMPKLAQPVRVALTGKASSPSIADTLALTGKPVTIERIDRAIAHVRRRMES